MTGTLDYYNKNADEFYKNTVNADLRNLYEQFEKFLKPKAAILDCGCGVGRDSKYFLEQGYNVTAIDGSLAMCEKASRLTGLSVECCLFQEIDEKECYDGVWACASLLHLKKNELADVFLKLNIALKNKGILYCSFKYGDHEGERNGRYFTDLTEESLREIIGKIKDLKIIKTWRTSDVRENRSDEKWLNSIIQKNVGD